MSSTFFGLHVAYSGLNAAQAQINTTANNISNVNTEGYSRQTVKVSAASSVRAYQKYGTTGLGVDVETVTQERDLYYDTKYWNNQSNLGIYEKKLYYMEQIEGYYSETTSKTGFTTLYAKMFNALDTVKTNAGDMSVKNQFISSAQELCTYFNNVSTQMKNLQSSINDEIKSTVDNINAIAQKIALLNKQINVIEMQGTNANELRDERALLVDELSEIAPVEAEEVKIKNSHYPDMDTGATSYTVKINGQMLVDNFEYNTLTCYTREAKHNQSDIDGLYDIKWTQTDAKFDATATNMSGSLKAMFEVRDGNNVDNLKGVVNVNGTSDEFIRITNLNVSDINSLNLPDSGSINVNNTNYKYDYFKVETDYEGNIQAISFHMDGILLPDKTQTAIAGASLEVGKSVDYMGIPYYQNQMNLFIRNLAEAFNNIQTDGGKDADGKDAGVFFVASDKKSLITDGENNEWLWNTQYKHEKVGTTEEKNMTDDEKASTYTLISNDTAQGSFYYQLTAENFAVAYNTKKNPNLLATTQYETAGQDAYDLVEKMLELEKKVELFRGGGGDTFLQCIYADITVDTQEASTFSKNYTNIKDAIQQQRLSISGVDEDDEALNLIKFQNAYNLASKCISVFTEIYDRLILNTGV